MAPLWDQWYTTQGKSGEEPVAAMKELYKLHERLTAAKVGSDEYRSAIDGIFRNYRENVWSFIPIEHLYSPTDFFSKRVKNVATGRELDVFGFIVYSSMEQWYIE